nr:GNAT family N-acetyltransferase [Andreprevotia sp. IGB-42]
MRAWIRDYLLPAGDVTVAEMDGVTSGFVATSYADGCSWIDQLYLQPNTVGQGIGAALLTHALADIKAQVRLHTFQANHGARRFYERFGFMAIAFGDGSSNEEHCPDVLYERGRNQLTTS